MNTCKMKIWPFCGTKTNYSLSNYFNFRSILISDGEYISSNIGRKWLNYTQTDKNIEFMKLVFS